MNSLVQTLSTTRPAIELDGIHGTFGVQNCSFEIQFFSTFAVPATSGGGEDHYRALLKELKPMRERVSAKDISDLNALLQRDLNDERIAQELVPYLAGAVSKVGFFPPVLAVLVPKGFIHQPSKTNKYPTGQTNGDVTEYGTFWKMRYHPQSNRLARLWIYDTTEIIVLDGQHRSNAFRYITGVMAPDNLHDVFYAGTQQLQGFKADLPVTIAWFVPKTKVEVKPNDISRELFVAVNNNAKPVSTSRTILLDDKDPVPLAINTYYSVIAERRGFRTGGLNLLASSFDIEITESQAATRSAFAVTNPVALEFATRYALFGNEEYDTLKRSKATKHAQTNKDRFERLFGPISYIQTVAGDGIKPLFSLKDRAAFRQEVRDVYAPILDALLEGSSIVTAHHQAVAELEDWVKADGAAIHSETWSRIFCGGEGLYGLILKNTADKGAQYRKAIKEIEIQFRKTRSQKVLTSSKVLKGAKAKAVDDLYDLFETMAFQTGILMAASLLLADLFEKNIKGAKARNKVCQKLQSLELDQWIGFLHLFKNLYLSDLEANSWPRFQKLFVRLFCPEIKIFSEHPDRSPDAEIIIHESINVLRGLALDGQHITPKKASEVVKKTQKDVTSVFRAAGVGILKGEAFEHFIKREVGKELDRLNEESAVAKGDQNPPEDNGDRNTDNGLI